MLRRRSLARLRREVEPVEPAALARFLPAGTASAGRPAARPPGRGHRPAGGPAAAGERAGARHPAGARARLRARGCSTSCGAAGEVRLGGAGSLGATTAASRSTGPTAWRCCCRAATATEPADRAGRAGRRWHRGAAHLAARGRLVLPRAPRRGAAGRDRGGRPAPGRARAARCALGPGLGRPRSRNDTFAPLRALRWPRRRRPDRGTAATGATAAHGPAGGRRTLVAGAGGRCHAPSPSGRRHRRRRSGATPWPTRLLERHGVVTRDARRRRGRRGWLRGRLPRPARDGGARPGPARLLRRRARRRPVRPAGCRRPPARGARRDPPGRPARATGDPSLLAATDPANPYGAALPWPATADGATLARAAGAYVVLLDGDLVLYLERGGRSLHTLPARRRAGAFEAGVRAPRGARR